MSETLKVLLINDSKVDLELIVERISKAGYKVDYGCVNSAEDMKKYLIEKHCDIVICDYSMPSFNPFDAIKILREFNANIPFIVVSGAIGEESVVELMKAGCQNCVMKYNMTRLPEVINREIKDAMLRKENRILKERSEKELIDAKNAAEAADKAKSVFLANMSHEIRTPLNGIMGMTQLMQFSDLNYTQKNYLDTIIKCSDNLVKIINDILDLSRIEADAIVFNNENFGIYTVINEIFTLFQNSVNEKKLCITTDIDPQIPPILYGDAGKLKQIICNLISNAIKFTDKGKILLEVKFEKKEKSKMILKVCVEDTGIGISKDDMKYIFKPFSQVDFSSTRKYGGNGLGLAICKKLVEKNSGEIWLESEKGKGSRFGFTYCVDVGSECSVVLRKESRPAQTFNMHNLRALVIDDDAISAEFVKIALEQIGINTSCSFSGEEALELLKCKKYDIILIDIVLPGIDGIEILKRIRAKEKGRAEKSFIIAATANTMIGKKEEYLNAGMDGYIEKPVKLDKLNILIKECSDKLQEIDDQEYDQMLSKYFHKNAHVCNDMNEIIKKLYSEITSHGKEDNAVFEEIERLADVLKYCAFKKGNKTIERYALKIQFAARINNNEEVQAYLKAIENELN